MLDIIQTLKITTDSSSAICAIHRFIDASLGYSRDAESLIQTAIAADPNCALAHAYAAAYYLSQEHAGAWKQARPHLQRAQICAAEASEREQLYIQAIAAWASGEIERAIALHEAITDRFPEDLMSVQQGQYHYFYLGDKERLLRIAAKVLPVHRDQHYLYGMVAFGLEQCHRLPEAEAMARQAIALNRQDPWAHHAIAHVLETQQRSEEGIAWMEQFADTWEHCNSMLYTHNWWHIALYYLARQEMPTVLRLYDRCVWGRANPDSPKDQVGAIALLLRLELRGVAVGDRWQSLSRHLAARLHEHALPFQDLHYVYALARAGHLDQAIGMTRSMQAHASRLNSKSGQLWSEITIPAAKGLIAHAQASWSTAIAELQPVLPRLWTIGGSHAQRELFEQIYRDARAKLSSYPVLRVAS